MTCANTLSSEARQPTERPGSSIRGVRRFVTTRPGTGTRMSDYEPKHLGKLDDDAEEQEQSDTTDGAAAAGEYDPHQGSPDSGPHAPDYEEKQNP